MADSTRTSPPSSTQDPTQEPGHYGAGYGEQVPESATPQLGPAIDGDPPPKAPREDSASDLRGPAAQTRGPTTRTEAPHEARGEPGTTGAGDAGEAVVFTPADVHARPPDQTPTDAAPESEKAGLIFERS